MSIATLLRVRLCFPACARISVKALSTPVVTLNRAIAVGEVYGPAGAVVLPRGSDGARCADERRTRSIMGGDLGWPHSARHVTERTDIDLVLESVDVGCARHRTRARVAQIQNTGSIAKRPSATGGPMAECRACPEPAAGSAEPA